MHRHPRIQDCNIVLSPRLDERETTIIRGGPSAVGYGRIAAVSQAATSTISRGLKQLACGSDVSLCRVRRPGAGRKPPIATDAMLLGDSLGLALPSERGDPVPP